MDLSFVPVAGDCIPDVRNFSRIKVFLVTGININVLIKSCILNDSPLYLKTFIKLCLELEASPYELLKESVMIDEASRTVLERLTYAQLRALVVHAMSYLESAHDEE